MEHWWNTGADENNRPWEFAFVLWNNSYPSDGLDPAPLTNRLLRMPPEVPIPWPLRLAFEWLSGQPVLSGLIVLMGIDVLVGIFLSISKKTLSSTVSWRGMSKKAIMLLIVGAAGVLQPFLPSVPILNIVSAFYTLTEALSILENAAAAGVPLPAGLVETLAKLREQRSMAAAQKSVTTVNNVTVLNSADYKPTIDVDHPKV